MSGTAPEIGKLPQPATESAGAAALRCIAALTLREMGTRYGRRPGGYVWAVLQPLGIIIIIAFAFSLIATSPALGTSFLLFKATGMLVLQTFNALGSNVGRAMNYSRALLFYPRVCWIDAVIARFLLNMLVSLAAAFVILTGIILFEDLKTVLDWGPIFLAIALICTLGLGIGCLNCYMFQRFPVWEDIWGILTAPLFVISGVLFLFEDLPPFAQDILWYNPLMHITGLMRDGFYPVYSPGYISVAYTATCALVPLVVGLMLLRQYHRDLLYR